MGVCDDMKKRHRSRRKDERCLRSSRVDGRQANLVDGRQAKWSNCRRCNCNCCGRVGRVGGETKTCSETQEVSLRRGNLGLAHLHRQ